MSVAIATASTPDWIASAGPAAGSTLSPGQIDLWLVDLDAPAGGDWLDGDERARAARLVSPQHARRYAAGRNALRLLLGRYLGLTPRRIAFTYGPKGKPALRAGSDRGLAFNLSHTGRYAVVAIGATSALGVDIEAVRTFKSMYEVAEATFAPAETRAFLSLPGERRLEGFFTCWTCKEAVVKFWGDGLSANLASFEVEVDPARPAALLALDRPGTALGDIALWGFRPVAGFRAALAAPSSARRPRFWRLAP